MQPAHPAFVPHDHGKCSADTLALAESYLAGKSARLTPVRRRVLEILLEEHRALGAYDVLDRLSKDGFGNQPPVAYRALEFLVEHGLAHRISAKNAFAACMHPGENHASVFLICKSCDRLEEAEATRVHSAISDAAGSEGFAVESTVVEALGLCQSCRSAA